MKLKDREIIYFLGIGGIGMSALARYFHASGREVMGYDRTCTPLTTELELAGIDIHYDDKVINIPQVVRLAPIDKVLVVITPAIPADSAEWAWFRDHGYDIRKRSEVLGYITSEQRTIAVAGTHGKTTTSSLIAHILTHSGHECNAFLGGIAVNYDSNLLLSHRAEWTVVEADEYDRSFLTLSPRIAVISSMDADHLDIYGSPDHVRESFNLFADKLVEGGSLIVRHGLPLSDKPGRVQYSYSLNEDTDFRAINIRVADGHYHFDLHYRIDGKDHELSNLTLGLPGRHNVENAVAACAASLISGVEPERLSPALASFRGVKRRFEYIIRRENLVYIDDYAHHPTEIEATVRSVRELHPGRRITGVFQPHLFTRTRDFGDDFAKSLRLLDDIILLPIYPAREVPIPGIDSHWLLNKISGTHAVVVEKNELLGELLQRQPEVLLTLGAGDIDEWVNPIADTLGR
ncbi:MAG: hypothetical protein RL220_593 [Bacteroidota bacterium]